MTESKSITNVVMFLHTKSVHVLCVSHWHWLQKSNQLNSFLLRVMWRENKHNNFFLRTQYNSISITFVQQIIKQTRQYETNKLWNKQNEQTKDLKPLIIQHIWIYYFQNTKDKTTLYVCDLTSSTETLHTNFNDNLSKLYWSENATSYLIC